MNQLEQFERIVAALVPNNPQILENDVKNPDYLFDIEGFRLPEDSDLTLYHVQMVLNTVKRKYVEGKYIFQVIGEKQ